jgi:hypothetical protein
MRVGIASDIAKQRLVIDIAALMVVEARCLASRIAKTQPRSAKSCD